MYRYLILFLLSSFTIRGQSVLHDLKNENYPDRIESDSVIQYITKANKYWKMYSSFYKNNGEERIDVAYNNNRKISLSYDSLGNGIRFIEFYEDKIGMELYFSKIDTSYLLKKYEWVNGTKNLDDFWYPNENRRELWFYSKDEVLEKILKVTKSLDQLTVDETMFDFFEGTTTRRIYKSRKQKWVLEKEFKLAQ